MRVRSTFGDHIHEGAQGGGHEPAGEVKARPFERLPPVRENRLKRPLSALHLYLQIAGKCSSRNERLLLGIKSRARERPFSGEAD
jgi:hypothetical protein